jgi:hypothetical protein
MRFWVDVAYYSQLVLLILVFLSVLIFYAFHR